MTDQPPTASDQPLPSPSNAEGGVEKQATEGVPKRSKLPWIAGGVAAILLLGAGAAVAYNVLKEDSGVAACKAIRDEQDNAGGDNDDMTESEYRETRELFADSGYEKIRNHGTRLVDLIWQMQQLPEGDEGGAFAYLGQLTEHMAGLQSACADQGVVFSLLDGDGADVDPAASGAMEPGSTSAPMRTEGSATTVAGRTFVWPDGIEVRLEKAEIVDRKLGNEVASSRSLVRVFFTFRNTTAQPVPIEAFSTFATVMYGPNHTEGKDEAGFGSNDPAEQLFNQDEPTRIAAGGELKMWRTWAVPNKELGQLAVKIEPPQVPGSMGVPEPYTFVDLEAILVGKR